MISWISCKQNAVNPTSKLERGDEKKFNSIQYAKGLSIESTEEFTRIEVKRAWQGATKTYKYLVVPKEKLRTMRIASNQYDAIVTTPIKSLVVTSTTHIPALEALEGLDKLVGFPNTQYISSKSARMRIASGQIRELGNNENLNTEMVINLQPDVVMGFNIANQNNSYATIKKAHIPVIYNSDWTEETPLGKAEWIKFFGVLLNKQKEADSIFRQIETSYLKIKKIATQTVSKPTVLSGALYKDVWYLPAGESWAAQFIRDAGGKYIYNNTAGSGSLSLSLESVLEKGQNTDIWIAPAQFKSYHAMHSANAHYTQFKAFNDKRIYTFANTQGATGGLLYYELGPQRPDLILKDLVHYFHPEILPNHSPYFFTPLK